MIPSSKTLRFSDTELITLAESCSESSSEPPKSNFALPDDFPAFKDYHLPNFNQLCFSTKHALIN